MSSIAESGAMAPPAADPKRSNLTQRVLSAAVLIPLVLLLVYLGGWPFALLVAVAAALMLHEWLHMLFQPRALPSAAAAVLMAVSVLAVQGMAPWAALPSLAAAALAAILAVSGPRSRLWIPLGIVWFAVPCMGLVWLRQSELGGMSVVIWMLLMIWAADTGAYIAGHSIGGPRLAPAISPNKTWAGLFGGMLAAVLVGVAFAWIVGSQAWLSAILVAALLAPWSQVGDLAESAVKRHVGVKDSSQLIPGHGGLLDRVDALLFAVPAIALFTAFAPAESLPWR